MLSQIYYFFYGKHNSTIAHFANVRSHSPAAIRQILNTFEISIQ
ncbi:hypothetical protein QUA70_12195 [Microcoleus sp. LAD1_D5]